MNIRKLPILFEKRGIEYQMLDKAFDSGSKESSKPEGYFLYSCKDLSSGDLYYELFRYRLVPPHPFDREDWDLVECYPSNEDFGKWAWSCSDKDCLVKVFKNHFGISYNF